MLLLTMEVAHKTVFFSLYFLLFLATLVFIERLLYFSFTLPAEKKLFLKEIEELNENRVEAQYHNFISKLTRGKGLLSFTITASPLLGLLGTVLGIMNSFLTMAEKGISDIVEVSKGIAAVGIETGKPISFGVLTTDTVEQAIDRAGTKAGNKGWEAALSAIEMVNLLREI